MRAQQRHRRQRAAAQAAAIDLTSIAITVGLGLLGVIAGVATLIH